MKKELAEGAVWRIEQTTELTALTVGAGAQIQVPDGKQLTLTVDGVHRNIEPGDYTGRIVLSVTEPIDYDIVNYGKTESFHMNAAVSVHGGKYCASESVEAAQLMGSAADGQAEGLKIRSQGDNFGGIYVDGDGSYQINDADIALQGNGASDGVGFGAGISVRGSANVIINRAKIHNIGSIRTALQVCGHGRVTVNDSDFSAADNEKPNYVMAMSKAPWMLGIHGRVRTTNIQECGEVTYNRCTIQAENWGALSTDGTQHVRLTLNDSKVLVTGSGYGAYSIGDCHDLFRHCEVHVPDYGTIQCSQALVTYTEGTEVYSDRIGVMMHGGGEPGLLTIDQKSKVTANGPVIQVKGRGAEILVDDASLVSRAGVLLEIIENDDPNGRGFHMGPETVMDVPPGGFPGGGPGDPMRDPPPKGEGPGGDDKPPMPEPGAEQVFPVHAKFRNTALTGDIYHCNTEKNDAEITLSNASLTGAVTTAVSSHPEGKPTQREQYRRIGEVELFPCPKDDAFGLSVCLENGAKWVVGADSYLTGLKIGAGCQVQAVKMTVNGVETPLVPGEYAGKLVLKPV